MQSFETVERIARKLTIAKQQTQTLREKVRYYEEVHNYINGCIAYLQNHHKHNLTNTNQRIKTIITTPKTNKPTQPSTHGCKYSNHLREIFDQNEEGKRKQKQLQNKLDEMYGKIEAILKKQQPYIWEKVMLRIKKEGKRQSQLKILASIKQQIKQHQNWLASSIQNAQSQSDLQKIEHQAIINLETMKQIMNQKISINDYLFGMINNHTPNENYLNRITFLKNKIYQQFIQYSKQIQQAVRLLSIQANTVNEQPIVNQPIVQQLYQTNMEMKNITIDHKILLSNRCKDLEHRILELQENI